MLEGRVFAFIFIAKITELPPKAGSDSGGWRFLRSGFESLVGPFGSKLGLD